jgi:ParB-like chromosome segregation protein Spo0J
MPATARRTNKANRAMPTITFAVRKLTELKPHPRNARRHSPAQVAQIAGIMQRFGWTNPALIDEDDFIIAGHARLAAAQSIGLSEGPTITVAGLSENEKRELMLADNRIQLNASWDVDLLRAELAQLRGDGVDLADLGFADAEIEKLLPPAEDAPAIEELDISTVQDRFWISVRGPLAQQAEALQRLKTLMAEIPGVTVELGTIDG